MFSDEFAAANGAAKTKVEFLKRNPIGYFIASMPARVFVGFGILLIFSIGGQLASQPYVKIVMGISFGIALSLVIIAGAELFTGNNLVMTTGLLGVSVRLSQVIKLWLICYIGNWLGSALLGAVFFGVGLSIGPVGEFIVSTATAKMSIPFFQLLLRGILCNILVCLAVWCSRRRLQQRADSLISGRRAHSIEA